MKHLVNIRLQTLKIVPKLSIDLTSSASHSIKLHYLMEVLALKSSSVISAKVAGLLETMLCLALLQTIETVLLLCSVRIKTSIT